MAGLADDRWLCMAVCAAVLGCMATDLFAQRADAESSPDSPVWKEFIYPKDGFAITLPGNPKPHKGTQLPDSTAYTVHLPQNAALTLHVANFANGCAPVYRDYMKEVKKGRNKRGPIVGEDGLTYNLDLSTLKELTVGGSSAVEHEQEITSATKAFQIYERYHCAGTRFYVFSATWPIGKKKPESVSRIVESFRLLPR